MKLVQTAPCSKYIQEALLNLLLWMFLIIYFLLSFEAYISSFMFKGAGSTSWHYHLSYGRIPLRRPQRVDMLWICCSVFECIKSSMDGIYDSTWKVVFIFSFSQSLPYSFQLPSVEIMSMFSSMVSSFYMVSMWLAAAIASRHFK